MNKGVKEKILEQLNQLDEQTLIVAYSYAKYLVDYGCNVTQKRKARNKRMKEILIRLEDELYEQCKNTKLTEENEGFDFHIIKSVANGTVLPKRHGDLIDRNKLVYDCSLGGGGCDHICRCDGCSYNIIREATINKAPTIIEADKGESEK